MILWYLTLLLCKIGNICDIQSNGTVLLEYYKDQDTEHQIMEPHLQMLNQLSLKNNINLKIQQIDCNSCNCPNLKSFPTYKILKNKKEVDSLSGYSEYSDLLKFVTHNMNIQVQNKNSIQILTERDFYSTFEDPYLVFFYKDEDTKIEVLLENINKVFENTIKIGKINHNESKNIISRYNITSFPIIIGIYNDLSIPFLEELTINNLINFSNKLVEPSLQKIQKKDLPDLISTKKSFYLVLYKDEKLANNIFFQYAHSFKFKINMYKSDDKSFYNLIGISESDQNNVKFTLYKNGRFHLYDQDIFDDNQVVNWIFHTHFPNVTKVSDLTFHSVFNGIKPVLLLLTTEDKLLDEFNQFSKNVHYGLPFINLIFASINLNEYMLFTQALLPKIEIPTFVIYDPLSKKFYHEKIILKSYEFKTQATKILKLYEGGKMKPYIRNSIDYFSMFLWCSILFLICMIIYAREKFLK